MLPSIMVVKGKIKCPMIVLWVLFSMHFLYLFVIFGLTEYISVLNVIFDVEILFNLQLTALFLTLSEDKDNYTYFLVSFIMSIINSAIIFFSIIITILAFYKRDKFINFIKPEPWLKDGGIGYIGAIFIVIKVIEFLPLILLSFYFKRIKTFLSTIESQKLNIVSENVAMNDKPDDNQI